MNFTTGTLCTIFLSLMLAACDSGSSAAEHVASAKQYIASGEQDAAEIELKNALQKDNKPHIPVKRRNCMPDASSNLRGIDLFISFSLKLARGTGNVTSAL